MSDWHFFVFEVFFLRRVPLGAHEEPMGTVPPMHPSFGYRLFGPGPKYPCLRPALLLVQPSWEHEVNPARSANSAWPTYNKWVNVSKAFVLLTAQFGLVALIIECPNHKFSKRLGFAIDRSWRQCRSIGGSMVLAHYFVMKVSPMLNYVLPRPPIQEQK